MARGATNHQSGASAEEAAARHYERAGATVVARRWRGRGGEVDLIAERDGETVFVEVKRAATHDEAAARLGPRQIARIHDCAAEYMATLPLGLLSPVRFDLALVDGQGRVAVLENALH